MEVVDRVVMSVMRGGWGWTLCNGFNPRDTTWSSSSESTWYSRLAPLMVPPATPLICASGLGNGDSAVAVACPPPTPPRSRAERAIDDKLNVCTLCMGRRTLKN